MAVDYNKIRFLLTESIRGLDTACDYLKKSSELRIEERCSEMHYWSTTLELIRNCLYGCTNEYHGSIDLSIAINEIQSEIESYILVHPYKLIEIDYIDKAYLNCTKIKEELCQ